MEQRMEQRMQTWEYKSESVQREEFDARLAQMQSDGWELVAFAPEEMGGSTAFGVGDLKVFRYRVVFRRQPPATPASPA